MFQGRKKARTGSQSWSCALQGAPQKPGKTELGGNLSAYGSHAPRTSNWAPALAHRGSRQPRSFLGCEDVRVPSPGRTLAFAPSAPRAWAGPLSDRYYMSWLVTPCAWSPTGNRPLLLQFLSISRKKKKSYTSSNIWDLYIVLQCVRSHVMQPWRRRAGRLGI
jgi:hypothetical protein